MLNYIVNIFDFIGFPLCVFLLGVWGLFVLRKSLILILISIELLLLAINLFLILFSIYLDDINGQVFALFVLTVAGGESAIGLAILVSFYRLQSLISIDLVSFFEGIKTLKNYAVITCVFTFTCIFVSNIIRKIIR